jgi:hypothetical protein
MGSIQFFWEKIKQKFFSSSFSKEQLTLLNIFIKNIYMNHKVIFAG